MKKPEIYEKPEIYGMDFVACGISPAADVALALGAMLVGCELAVMAA